VRLRTVEDEDEDDVYICNARERLFSARHGITCSVLVSVASPSWGVKKTLGSVVYQEPPQDPTLYQPHPPRIPQSGRYSDSDFI